MGLPATTTGLLLSVQQAEARVGDGMSNYLKDGEWGFSLDDVSESSWPNVVCVGCDLVLRPRKDWNDRFTGVCKSCQY